MHVHIDEAVGDRLKLPDSLPELGTGTGVDNGPLGSCSMVPTWAAKRQTRSQSMAWVKIADLPPTPSRTASAATGMSSKTSSPIGERAEAHFFEALADREAWRDRLYEEGGHPP